MKSASLKLFATAAMVALTFAGTAQAVQMIVDDGTNHTFTASNSSTWSHTGLFDLTLAPNSFSPSTQDVNSAIARFEFEDVRGTYNIDINLGAYDWNNAANVSVDFDFQGGVTGNALLDLNADGKLYYTISAGSMDVSDPTVDEFYLDRATLTAEVSSSSIPDSGSTVVLLGSAIATLGLIARRRKVV